MLGAFARIAPLPEDLAEAIEGLYVNGLFLQARALGERHAPLHRWRGLRGLLLARRVCGQLGDDRRAHALATLAWRQFPQSVPARAAYARGLVARVGLYGVWQFLQRHHALDGATAAERAEWLAVEAVVLAMLRDFPNATNRIERALDEAGDDAWIRVEHSTVLALEDRHDETLAAARHALALGPRYVAAIQATVEALQALGRAEEALALLRETAPALESFALARALVGLLIEGEAYAEAQSHAARLPELAPLLSPAGIASLHGLRSRIAYSLGDDATALDEARQAGPGFHATVAATLAAWSGPPRQVRLPVPFVQQHFKTCGPATLTALARFWGFAVDHDDLAQQIAYEGTWDHEERHWAETSLGCVVREFTVTWEATLALLDRGVPFSLTTIQTTAAHLQAVIGYDARRGTLLVQDPSGGLVEYVRTFLDEQAVLGPRGMALVPKPEAGRLDGCPLPDADRRDALYRLKRALVAHDRDAAAREADALAGEGHDDLLAIEARWAIAQYDGDPIAGLTGVEALLARYPDSEWLASRKYQHLITLARRGDRLALVEAMTSRPMCDPVWAQYAAQEYRLDARTWPRADLWARRALRRLPTEAGAYDGLSMLRAQQRRLDEACALARFAACLNPTDDVLSEFYVGQAALCGRAEEALGLLRWRVHRYGSQSSLPAQTLFTCLARTYRFAEAFEVLASALERRPQDPDLLLFAAREYARDGDHQRAEALLERARPLTRPARWAQVAAETAMGRGDLQRSVDLLRSVVAALPLELRAHADLATLLNQLDGWEAALAHLRTLAERWPHHLNVQQLYVEWMKASDPDQLCRMLQTLVDAHPTFVWAHRELAWQCRLQGRLAEAAVAAEAALALDPHASASHAIRGAVRAAGGETAAAAADFREAIRLDADNAYAIDELVANADTAEHRREALAFIRGELERQTVFGAGLSGYREAARAVLAPDEVLALCREALAARPDLLPAWTETIRQLLDMADAGAALALVERAIEQFPVIAELYVLQAQGFLLAGDGPRRIDALARARELAPTQIMHGVALGAALIDAGRLDDAYQILQETVRRAPADVEARMALADAQWLTMRRGDAIDTVEQAIQRAPDSPGAWNRLQRWSLETRQPERPEALARRLSTDRPRDPRAWKALAAVVEGRERLDALHQVVELAPRDEQARDVLAEALADAGRVDEALVVCQATTLGPMPPLILRGRAAWLEAARGRRAEAITRMRQVLDERPSYVWGWLQLANWYAEEHDHDHAVQAAGWLTRLMPADAGAWAQLGRIQLAAGRRVDGKAALRQALELDGQHDWAGLLLIDTLIEDQELDAADTVVQRLSRTGDDQWLLLRVVRLAAARGDRAAADRARDILRRRAGHATAPADVARAYGIVEADWWHPEYDLDVLAAYVRQDARGAAAAAAFLDRVIELRKFDAGHTLQAACRAVFERDVDLWGEWARLLLEQGYRGDLVEWMRGWQSRPGRAPWMLLNLAVALRGLGDWSAAAIVHADAERLSADHSAPGHRCWLALDDALAGRLDAARARLDGVEVGALGPYYRALQQFVVACVEGSGTILAAAAATVQPESDAALRRAHRRCRAFLMRRRGGPWNRLIAWFLERLAGTTH